ncbi:MAG: sialate O-acetylesterase [Chthoniobacterales bacterium]
MFDILAKCPLVGILLLIGGFVVFPLRADVSLPSLLSAHAVLQKSAATRIWGMAAPNEAVHVVLGKIKAETTADASGRWQTQVDLTQSPQGPFDLVVEGKNKIVVPDVVVGEVWLCSGQSNMQYALRGDINAPVEIKLTNSFLRQFKVEIASAPTPLDDCKGSWILATPATVGDFTGVGYYFGKKLQTELTVPVGLIHSSIPGSAIEVWMSSEAFAKRPAMDAGRVRRLATFNEYPGKLAAYVAAFQAWVAKYSREDQAVDPALFAAPGVATDDWKKLALPGKVAASGFSASGAIWARKTVNVPAVGAGKPGNITFGTVRDFVTIYWNGVEIAKTSPANPPALGIYKFIVPGEVIKEGENVIALRISGVSDQNGCENGLSCSFNGVGQAVRLEGDWLAKVENSLPALSPEALATLPKPPGVPNPALACYNYNAMIAPLLHDTIKGIIWYQGESNVNRPDDYRVSITAMIEDYREKWGAELPFYFCQLPNFQPRDSDPSKGCWADLRDAQTSALALPKTGMAVLIDVGEEANLHPRNKKDPGERLGRIALAKDYGKPIAFSGPHYDSLIVEGDKLRLKFSEVNGGLMAKPLPATYKPNSVSPETKPLVRLSPNSELEGFVICGDDHKWIPADAKIDGEAVIVSSTNISKPVAARYLWADSPIGNLYNAATLPAAPFRTDEFPLKKQPFAF